MLADDEVVLFLQVYSVDLGIQVMSVPHVASGDTFQLVREFMTVTDKLKCVAEVVIK